MVFHRGLLETKMEEIPEVTKKLAPFAKKQSRNIIMEKKIRKRYHSEEAVKKALKIESFRNLTKDKVMEFTSMIPYMEKEVALEIICRVCGISNRKLYTVMQNNFRNK